jgi:predicted dehydrogenase
MEGRIRTAIIGCGNIAGGYDESSSGDGIFSHAGAYRSIEDIQIEAAFDIDKKKSKVFSAFWGIEKSCNNLQELLDGQYDIVSVCTSDDTHEEIIEKILNAGCARCIWAEKPLTTNIDGARKVIEKAKEKGVGLWLSNQRRWEPGHISAKEKIHNGVIGELIHVTAYYVKGITHIGCTVIDTIRFLCGELMWVEVFPPFNVGSYGNDSSLRSLLGFKNGATATIVGCDVKEYVYSLFELDIIGTHGRIKIEENGDSINIFEAKEYDHYPGFKELKLTVKVETDMKWSMKYGLGLILKDLREKKQSTLCAEEGLKDLYVIDAIKKSAIKGGARIEF